MINLSENKKKFRIEVKKRKKEFSPEQKKQEAQIIWQKIEALDVFVRAPTVMLYWAMHDEVPTEGFIDRWFAKKQIVLPAIDGDILMIKLYKGRDLMCEGQHFGIPEPKGDAIADDTLFDVIIVPGVAFDSKNNRLGRGRGFYDRLLANTTATKIGVCFSFQFFDDIPHDSNDIPMDFVICGK